MPKPERNLLQIRLEKLFQELESRSTKLTELKNYETAPARFKDFITYVQEAVTTARAQVEEYFAPTPAPTLDEVLKWVTMKETGTYLVLYEGDEIIKRLIIDEADQFSELTVKYIEREVQATLKKRLLQVTIPSGDIIEKPVPKGVDGYKVLTVGKKGKKQEEPKEGTVKVLTPEPLPPKERKNKAKA